MCISGCCSQDVSCTLPRRSFWVAVGLSELAQTPHHTVKQGPSVVPLHSCTVLISIPLEHLLQAIRNGGQTCKWGGLGLNQHLRELHEITLSFSAFATSVEREHKTLWPVFGIHRFLWISWGKLPFSFLYLIPPFPQDSFVGISHPHKLPNCDIIRDCKTLTDQINIPTKSLLQDI